MPRVGWEETKTATERDFPQLRGHAVCKSCPVPPSSLSKRIRRFVPQQMPITWRDSGESRYRALGWRWRLQDDLRKTKSNFTPNTPHPKKSLPCAATRPSRGSGVGCGADKASNCLFWGRIWLCYTPLNPLCRGDLAGLNATQQANIYKPNQSLHARSPGGERFVVLGGARRPVQIPSVALSFLLKRFWRLIPQQRRN